MAPRRASEVSQEGAYEKNMQVYNLEAEKTCISSPLQTFLNHANRMSELGLMTHQDMDSIINRSLNNS